MARTGTHRFVVKEPIPLTRRIGQFSMVAVGVVVFLIGFAALVWAIAAEISSVHFAVAAIAVNVLVMYAGVLAMIIGWPR